MTHPIQQSYAGAFRYGRYYQHSGQINAGGLLAALAVGAVAGVVLGGVYAVAVVFIPFIKLNALLCLFYGIALGLVPAWLLRKMKVRNVPISLVVVTLVTLLSYYFCWASWEKVIGRNEDDFPSLMELVTRPRLVYDIAQVVNEHGTWSMSESSKEAMSGTALLAVWGIEAALIFGGALVTARTLMGEKPFCEKCEQWCVGPKTIRVTAPVDDNTLRTKLEAGDMAYVATLPPPTSGQSLEFQQHRCDGCKQLVTLTVVKRLVTRDKKGRAKAKKTKTIIKKLLVQDQDLQKMMPAAPAANAGQKPLPGTV